MLLGVLVTGAAPAAEPHVVARVLGVAQDGGVPHLGCVRECCAPARRDPSRAARVASLALVVGDPSAGRKVFIIDATPDFRSQVDSALGEAGLASRPRGFPVDGILLTHAHIGHYTGLMYLGRESIAAVSVPVYATARMSTFLSTNGPWKRLLEGGHIDLKPLVPGQVTRLTAGLAVEPVRVPHREEDSDVVGFIVNGPSRRLVYIPDIDDWGRWERDIAALVRTADVALLDGTFYSPQELGARSITDVPHPLMPSTMDRLEAVVKEGHKVLFIHLNHTNPAMRADTTERRELVRRGFDVAVDGLELPL